MFKSTYPNLARNAKKTSHSRHPMKKREESWSDTKTKPRKAQARDHTFTEPILAVSSSFTSILEKVRFPGHYLDHSAVNTFQIFDPLFFHHTKINNYE